MSVPCVKLRHCEFRSHVVWLQENPPYYLLDVVSFSSNLKMPPPETVKTLLTSSPNDSDLELP